MYNFNLVWKGEEIKAEYGDDKHWKVLASADDARILLPILSQSSRITEIALLYEDYVPSLRGAFTDYMVELLKSSDITIEPVPPIDYGDEIYP
jgi:hypothetical protein